jgi:aminoglycoside phosphotransferase (APT) family kinase protein
VIVARAVARAEPALSPAAARWRHRSELRWVGAMAPRVLAREGGPEDGWRTHALRWTGTSVAIAVVAHPRDPRRFVVKVPATAEGVANLRRQRRVLSALERDRRLRDWKAPLPRPLHEGEVAGRYYCVEEALPGEQAARLVRHGRDGRVLLGASARLIEGLHSRTAREELVDGAAVEAWVELPLRRLERFAGARPRRAELRAGLDRLRHDLAAALLGRRVRRGWIHGDYWPGNILASSEHGRVTGIVDWDQATAGQLPLHDLLHLHLHARRLALGEELGDVVVGALTVGVPEAIGVPAGVVDGWTDGIPARAALLLCWLRHATLFLDSDGHRDNRYWLRHNVEKVLLRA